jgi:outer membrane lipoprotein carrier protein
MKAPSFLLRKFAFLLLAASLANATDVADVHAIAQAVDSHYNRLRTLQADFSETYRGNGMERVESGTLWLKKPGKMRWEYRSPKQKLFLSDGKNAWFYVPGDRQARKIPVRKLDDVRSPLGFLLGKTKLEKELQGLSRAPDLTPTTAGDIVLRGVPRALADRVNFVVLEITSENWIRRIVIEEMDGSSTEFLFQSPKENVEIFDQRFRFTPPAGVETVQEDMGQ